jgi:hypothetical protein
VSVRLRPVSQNAASRIAAIAGRAGKRAPNACGRRGQGAV